MKKYLKRIILFIIILSTVVCSVLFVENNYLVLSEDNFWRVKNFYKEPRNSLDVVLMGASEVCSEFSPGLAYEEFGFTSYPFAFDNASVEVWKSQLIEIQKTQQPELILIEINGALYENDEQLFDDAALRRYTDSIPFSINKIETLSSCKLHDDLWSYYIPFIKYRDAIGKNIENYQALESNYREKKYNDSIEQSKLKGFRTKTFIDSQQSINVNTDKSISLNNNAEKLLTEFLSYCKENNIRNIVFFSISP